MVSLAGTEYSIYSIMATGLTHHVPSLVAIILGLFVAFNIMCDSLCVGL